MTRIKICGITNEEDAKQAVDAGADFLGFLFVRSPRQVSPEMARAIVRKLPARVEAVGVVRDLAPDAIRALRKAVGFSWVQLHGEEPSETARCFYPRVIKAFSRYRHGVATFRPYAGAVLLLDQPKRILRSPGRPGSGTRDRAAGGGAAPRPLAGKAAEAFLHLARQARHYGKVLLAGSLDASNVGDWVRRLRPWGVDVARGVESYPGKKDPRKMREFVEAVRGARG